VEIISKFFSAVIFSPRRFRFLLGVTAVAFVIRLAIIIFAGNAGHPEMYEHGNIAENLYSGHGFAMHWPYTPLDPARIALMEQPPEFEGAFMPPINPYLIFFAYSAVGKTALAATIIMLINALFSSLIPYAVYSAAKLFSSENESRVSAAISVLFLPAAFAVVTFSGSSFYQLLGVITLAFAIRSATKASYKNFLLMGLCAGIMTLLRSEFLVLGFILLAASGYFAFHFAKEKKIFPSFILGCVAMTVVIAPWTIRNENLFGEFIPVVDHPWHEIWRGNNIYATGSNYNAAGNAIWENAAQYPQIIKAMDSLPLDQKFDLRADSIFKHEAVTFVKDHPVRFAELGAWKIFALLTIDYYYPTAGNPIYFIFVPIVTILSLAGMIALVRERKRSPSRAIGMLYGIFFLYYCAIVVTTFMLPRYQIYVFSVLLPMTGIGLEKMRGYIQRHRQRTI